MPITIFDDLPRGYTRASFQRETNALAAPGPIHNQFAARGGARWRARLVYERLRRAESIRVASFFQGLDARRDQVRISVPQTVRPAVIRPAVTWYGYVYSRPLRGATRVEVAILPSREGSPTLPDIPAGAVLVPAGAVLCIACTLSGVSAVTIRVTAAETVTARAAITASTAAIDSRYVVEVTAEIPYDARRGLDEVEFDPDWLAEAGPGDDGLRTFAADPGGRPIVERYGPGGQVGSLVVELVEVLPDA